MDRGRAVVGDSVAKKKDVGGYYNGSLRGRILLDWRMRARNDSL